MSNRPQPQSDIELLETAFSRFCYHFSRPTSREQLLSSDFHNYCRNTRGIDGKKLINKCLIDQTLTITPVGPVFHK